MEIINQEFDRVRIVFDRDEFPDFDEAIQQAAEYKINCAWSNESFELWLLLHFKGVSEYTSRKDLCDLLEAAIRNELHKTNPEALYNYSKSDAQIYEHRRRLSPLGPQGDEDEGRFYIRRLARQAGLSCLSQHQEEMDYAAGKLVANRTTTVHQVRRSV